MDSNTVFQRDPSVSAGAFTVDSIESEQAEAEEAERTMKDQKKIGEKLVAKRAELATKTTKAAVTAKVKQDDKDKKAAEEVYKKDLRHKINKYLENFPMIAQKVPKLSERASLPEYEELLYLIHEELNTQRSLVNLKRYADAGVTALETFWGDGSKLTMLPPPLRFNVRGMSEQFRAGAFGEEIEPILLELDIEYPWLGQQSLPMRLIGAVSTMMLKTHIMNMSPNARKLSDLQNSPPIQMSQEEQDL